MGYGRSVSTSYDGSIVVSGAWGDDADCGAAYLFEKGSAWSGSRNENRKLIAYDGVALDRFGEEIFLSASGATLVVGAFGENGYQGSIYVFE